MTSEVHKFHHPYEPYDIQLQLMHEIYDTIDKGKKVGLFESPTGTGKTLSLICSTMTWLRNHKKMDAKPNEQDSDSDSDPEWVKESYAKSVVSKYKLDSVRYENQLDKAAIEYENKISRVHKLEAKKMKIQSDENYVPEDYLSDTEINERSIQLKNEVNRLLNRVDNGDKGLDLGLENSTKIYFSSRTHSQLSQFSGQLSLTEFESSLGDLTERTKYLPMGSRKQLCVHPRISKMNNLESINDACSDLNKNGINCEFLCNSRQETIQRQFNEYSHTKIHDVQDLKLLGEHLKICPYYSVRDNLKLSEVISMPYQMLLDESTRETLKVKVKDSIIIVDEAHNLLDTINALNSASLSLPDLKRLNDSLKIYLNKFVRRLNSGNRINLMKMIKICKILTGFVEKSVVEKKVKQGSEISINEIFVNNTGDMFNIHKLNTYLKKSKIAFKIETYLEKNVEGYQASANPLLFKLVRFLKCLSNLSQEGNFFWDATIPELPSIRYMLLDPSELFRPIVEDCRCLILAGGTMEPMSDYTEYLFPYLSADQIHNFSCDHIIPNENLKAIPVTSYKGQTLDFRLKNRNDINLARSLGHCLVDLMKCIPDGVVVFFPSYKFLNETEKQWKELGILDEMVKVKGKVFLEPSSSSDTDKVLNNYTKAIKIANGAVLLSVVGGKLSEGINFLDELARAVIMIGLPYPNLMSGELIAKKTFIEQQTIKKSGSAFEAKENGRNFVENICMRAINQSVGRSIRHINDYSMIYLIDERYRQTNIQQKLSGWIRHRIINDLSFDRILQETDEFFMTKSIKKLV